VRCTCGHAQPSRGTSVNGRARAPTPCRTPPPPAPQPPEPHPSPRCHLCCRHTLLAPWPPDASLQGRAVVLEGHRKGGRETGSPFRPCPTHCIPACPAGDAPTQPHTQPLNPASTPAPALGAWGCWDGGGMGGTPATPTKRYPVARVHVGNCSPPPCTYSRSASTSQSMPSHRAYSSTSS
jgi:hypothetical protein